jgi:hypothetical protein
LARIYPSKLQLTQSALDRVHSQARTVARRRIQNAATSAAAMLAPAAFFHLGLGEIRPLETPKLSMT